MIGLLGGSFDPVHQGHIDLAAKLLEQYHFSKIYFIPAQKNPLKETATTASGEMRLELLKAALEEHGNPKLQVLDLEIKRSGPSYTYTTVEEIKKTATEPLVLILGNEVFKTLPNWHRPKELLESIDCIVINRDPHCDLNVNEILREIHIVDGVETTKNFITHSGNFRKIEKKFLPVLPISATQVRNEIEELWNTSKLDITPRGIQRSVWLLIKVNHLYSRKG